MIKFLDKIINKIFNNKKYIFIWSCKIKVDIKKDVPLFVWYNLIKEMIIWLKKVKSIRNGLLKKNIR